MEESHQLTLSLVIVTYNRDQVLIDTIGHLLSQADECPEFMEFLIIDQTKQHSPEADGALKLWAAEKRIRWIRLPEPDLVGAMNRGLVEAQGEVILYTDDDVIPRENLLKNHVKAFYEKPDAGAVIGQVIQPRQSVISVSYDASGSHLKRYMNFPFNSSFGRYVENVIGCNLAVRKDSAISVGGFDENYRPPVASRFETEFAKRLVKNGGKIWFEPSASLHHLAAKSGGTRSKGSHLTSASPRYGVGDHYYALVHGRGVEKYVYCLRRLFREVRTKFHLRHPWYIPVKLIGEIRAFVQAVKLARGSQKLLE